MIGKLYPCRARGTPTHRTDGTAWPTRRVARVRPVLAILVLVTGAVLLAAGPVYAAPPGADEVNKVVENIRLWLMAIIVTVATLFAAIGGLRYLAANGDPGEVEKAKSTLRSAALGYLLAALAPVFVTVVGGWLE